MGTMLILKAVLLLGVASESKYLAVWSSPISGNPVPSTTSKSKRDFTTAPSSFSWSTEPHNFRGKQYSVQYSSTSIPQDSSQAETTANTIKAHNPSQSVTYSPYQYFGGNVQGQHGPSTHGQIIQTTSALPSLQGGFQASHDPRQQTNGFKKTSAPYTPQSSQRLQNKVASSGNHNSQYFTNPSSYRLHPEPSTTAPQIKLNSFSTSGGAQNYLRFDSDPAVRPNRRSPAEFGSYENLSKFRFNPGTTFNVQATPLIGSGQRSNNPIYKSNSYSGSNNLDISPTSFSSELSSAPSFKSFNKLDGNYQYGGAPSVSYANKHVSIPDSIQFKNSPQSSGFIRAFDSEPVILSTGLGYQPQPSSGLRFDFPKSSSASLPARPDSFTSAIGNYQPHILPVHPSSSNAQIPKYNGASMNTFASNEYAKPDGGYQLLANQPQLHFSSAIPLQSVGGHQPTIYHANRPFEQIRTDVEVINKNRPKLPRPDDSYEHDFDGGLKIGKNIGHFGSDGSDVSAPVKNPVRDSSFEVPSSNLFNSYDEAFGKYSKLASREQDSVKANPKPDYQSAEDDGDNEDKSGEYSSSYSGGSSPNSSYEDEDEDESRRSERLQARDEGERKNGKNDHDDKSDVYKSYGVDFEKEFEESYRQKLPTNDYVHVKEVPEIEETASELKKLTTNRDSSKASRGGIKQKSRHVVQGEYEEPKEFESYTSNKYENPKATYKDSEGHGSRTSYRQTNSSEPASEHQSYGYKIPRDRGTTRYTESNDSETRTSDKKQQRSYPKKSSNTREATFNRPYNSSRQSSNVPRSVMPPLSPIELIESFTFPPFSSAKAGKQPLGKQVSRATDLYGSPTIGVEGLVTPAGQGYRLPQVHREGLRYFTNGQAVQDSTGI